MSESQFPRPTMQEIGRPPVEDINEAIVKWSR